MTTLIPIEERRAAQSAAQAAIDSTHAAEKDKAARLLREADAVAKRDAAALLAQAGTADEHARQYVARAFTLQVTPLVSELLKHEHLEIARELCAKYRSLQAEAVKYHGREFPLMPFVTVGQIVISHDAARKDRVARLGTFGGFDAYSAAAQIAAAHKALMSQHDARGIRDAVFALERRLVEVGTIAIPGAFADEIWEALKRGLGFYEVDELVRDLSQPKERARLKAAAAQYVPPHKVTYGSFVRNAISSVFSGAPGASSANA